MIYTGMLKIIAHGLGLISVIFTVGYAQDKGFVQNSSEKISRNKAQSLFETAQTFFYEQQYRATVDLTQQITVQHPGFAEAYLLQGMAKEKLNDFSGALVAYDVTVHMQPQWAEARFKRALLLFNAEKFDRAMEDFQDLLQRKDTETQAVFFKGQQINGRFHTDAITTMQSDIQSELYNYLGLSAMHLNQLSKARAYFDSAIFVNPQYPDAFNNRGILREKLSDTTGALQDYQEALQLQPSHENALHNLTYLARKSSRQEIVQKVVDQTVESEASAASYFQRGLVWQEQGQYQEALNDLNQALSLEASVPEYYLQRGFVKEKLTDTLGALQDYTAALRLDPLLEKAYSNRGNVYFKIEDMEKAVEDYNNALQLNPTNEKVYFNRGLAQHKLQQQAASCQDLQKALELGYQPAQKALEVYCKTEP